MKKKFSSLVIVLFFIPISGTLLLSPHTTNEGGNDGNGDIPGVGESKIVYPGSNGKLIYVKHANTEESNKDNTIPDFSHCGYMGGGVAIPNIPVKITVSPQNGDDRQNIQDAIDYVSGLNPDANGFRGTVLLKAGTYQVDSGLSSYGDALKIQTSGVIIRGEGQGHDGTIIQTTFEAKHAIIKAEPMIQPSISTSDTTIITDSYVGTGATSFNVNNAGSYSSGDLIHVIFTPNQQWLDDIYANNYMDSGDTDWTTDVYTIKYERQVTAISGNRITINSPIVQPMQSRFGGGEIKKIHFSSGERLTKVGVENLRLVGPGITSSCPADDSGRLQHAVRFEHVENAWVSGVTVLHTSNAAVRLWYSHYVTVQDCASLTPLGPKSGGYRYTYYICDGSTHCLVQRTYAEDGRHDYVLGARTPGPNVFIDGYSVIGGTTGPHQRWATGCLFDGIKLESLMATAEHRGSSGTGHSWSGAQMIAWNIEADIVNDAPVGHLSYAIGTVGNEKLSNYNNNQKEGVYRGYYDSPGAHVSTRSLYLKQLEDRLGINAVREITTFEQLNGYIWEQLAAWKGEGRFGTPNDTHDIYDENFYFFLSFIPIVGVVSVVSVSCLTLFIKKRKKHLNTKFR